MWQETNFANRGADCDFGQTNCDFERANYDFGQADCDFEQADYDIGSKKDTGWVIFLSRSAGIKRKMLAFTAICLFPDAYHAKRVKANWLFQPVSYPTKKRYFNPASRLHARITRCGSAGCCERYILHASFTAFTTEWAEVKAGVRALLSQQFAHFQIAIRRWMRDTAYI